MQDGNLYNTDDGRKALRDIFALNLFENVQVCSSRLKKCKCVPCHHIWAAYVVALGCQSSLQSPPCSALAAHVLKRAWYSCYTSKSCLEACGCIVLQVLLLFAVFSHSKPRTYDLNVHAAPLHGVNTVRLQGAQAPVLHAQHNGSAAFRRQSTAKQHSSTVLRCIHCPRCRQGFYLLCLRRSKAVYRVLHLVFALCLHQHCSKLQ